MKAVAVMGHQTFEQRHVHAMQILQGIDDRELRPQVQLQGGMSDVRKIHQHHAPMSLLQSDGCVHGGSGTTDSTLGVQKSKDPSLAGTALGAAHRGCEAGKSFDHRLAVGAPVEKFARARSHGGDDVSRLAHLADRKNCDVAGGGMNHFNGADGTLRILRINIHHHNFRTLIEDLTKHGIARCRGESDMAEHGPGHVSAFHPGVQNDGLFAILGKDGDGYPVHESILAVHGHATNFLPQDQVTFVIEGTSGATSRGGRGSHTGHKHHPAAGPEHCKTHVQRLEAASITRKSWFSVGERTRSLSIWLVDRNPHQFRRRVDFDRGQILIGVELYGHPGSRSALGVVGAQHPSASAHPHALPECNFRGHGESQFHDRTLGKLSFGIEEEPARTYILGKSGHSFSVHVNREWKVQLEALTTATL